MRTANVADGAADAPDEQKDAAVPDLQDEPRAASTDAATSGMDAAVDSASEVGASDTSIDTSNDASIDTSIDSTITLDGTAPEVVPMDAGIDAWPDAIASRQSVRFTIESQRVGWAVTSADRCGAINIERQGSDGTWQPLVLGIPYQCGCECPQPPDFAVLQSLSSPPMLTWDARELAVVTEMIKCPTTPGKTQDIPMLHAFPQPVAPGHYRASVAVLNSLPFACTQQAGTGRASCTSFSSSPYPFGALTEYKACPGDLTASSEFDLPESGDVDVYLLVS